jgi:hypothetical protein
MHPKVHLSLEIKDVRDIARIGCAGPFDIGIMRMPLEDSRVECKPLVTGRCVCSHATKSSSGTQARGFRRKNGSNLATQYSSRADSARPFLGRRQVFGVGRYPHKHFRLPVCRQRARACHHRPYAYRAVIGLGLVARPIRPTLEFSLGFFFPANRPRCGE